MKRTDSITKIISAAIFIAILAYLLSSLPALMSDRLVTTQAVRSVVSTSAVANGIIVRDEEILQSSEPYIDIIAKNGERIGVNQTIANAMSSEQGLARAERIHELELEISRLSAILGSINSSTDITSRDASIKELILTLTSSVSRGETDDLDSVSLNLSSLLFTDSSQTATDAELQALRYELESLRGSSAHDTKEISLQKSGIFTRTIDGHESLSPERLGAITPQMLSRLIEEKDEISEDAFGKLVSGTRWYFAAVISSANLSSLKSYQESGAAIGLDFGRYYSGEISARIEHISAEQDGECAVIFSCDSAMAETLNLREVTADVILETYDGIRIPTQAIRTDPETETSFVYVVTAMQIEHKEIEILHCEDYYAIVARSPEANALREGNTVVVEGDVEEGDVLK